MIKTSIGTLKLIILVGVLIISSIVSAQDIALQIEGKNSCISEDTLFRVKKIVAADTYRPHWTKAQMDKRCDNWMQRKKINTKEKTIIVSAYLVYFLFFFNIP